MYVCMYNDYDERLARAYACQQEETCEKALYVSKALTKAGLDKSSQLGHRESRSLEFFRAVGCSVTLGLLRVHCEQNKLCCCSLKACHSFHGVADGDANREIVGAGPSQ
mmetsp:Transcript_13479/g.23995  ORF Transcript_13479/g.23995 Transcript_13479/m.23995 type:complete len:109 (-) Transcript_13479:598-924(-)